MTDFPVSDLGPHLAAVDVIVKGLMQQDDFPCCSASHMEQNDPRRTMREDIDYIAGYYGVPARIGGRVRYTGNPDREPVYGTITGTEQARLLVRLDGHNTSVPLHPTWEIQYRQDEP